MCRAPCVVVTCAALLAWTFVPVAVARAPSARDVVKKASAYVQALDLQLVAIVGDELYRQRSYSRASSSPPSELGRVLRARIAWVHLPRLGETIAVRDVVQVSDAAPGSPAASGDLPAPQQSRLHRLLRAPGADLDAQVRTLLDESATHNLAPGTRNINFPSFGLVYLREPHVRNSRWKVERQDGGLTVVSFEERGRPTAVRADTGDHLRARGRFWLDGSSGRVERIDVSVVGQEQIVTLAGAPVPGVMLEIHYRQEVSFLRDERLAVWLPSRMTDTYQRAGDDSYLEVTGEALYSGYRRFETTGRVVEGAR